MGTKYSEVDQDLIQDLLPTVWRNLEEARQALQMAIQVANEKLEESSVAPFVADGLKRKLKRRGEARVLIREDGYLYLETVLEKPSTKKKAPKKKSQDPEVTPEVVGDEGETTPPPDEQRGDGALPIYDKSELVGDEGETTPPPDSQDPEVTSQVVGDEGQNEESSQDPEVTPQVVGEEGENGDSPLGDLLDLASKQGIEVPKKTPKKRTRVKIATAISEPAFDPDIEALFAAD